MTKIIRNREDILRKGGRRVWVWVVVVVVVVGGCVGWGGGVQFGNGRSQAQKTLQLCW